MQSGGGNPMNAAQLARLQQQLAQYGRGNGQQQMMNPGTMGGMGNQQNQQQLQQAFMQQQLGQSPGQQGGMQVRRNSALGMNSNSAAALAMMQQQQQQQQAAAGGSQMANANMSSYWNALQNQNSGAMDASSASGAQLAALAGMNMGGGGNNNSQNTAANMLLGNRSSQSQQQPQVQGMGNSQQAQAGGGMGQTNDANLLQQQIAQLQRQLQQQQQQNPQPSQGMGMQGNSGMDRRNSGGNFAGMQGNQQQQQLYQQMQQQMANGMMSPDSQQTMGGSQQQSKMGNDQFSSMNTMMQGQNAQQMQQNLRGNSGGSSQGMMPGQSRGGTLNEQELLLQQQQLLRSSGMSNNNMQNDAQKVQDMFMNQQNSPSDLMGQRRSSMQPMDGMNRSGHNQNMGGGFNNGGFDMDGSMSSQRSASRQNQSKSGSPLDVSGVQGQMPGDKVDDSASNQKSFLDGSFAGGWQSNADLPDRRRIIFSILEVIRQMRPDTNKISQKLPHMAKSLEEHLYRSAQTKEEYLDPSTLKKRLQLIAHGLEIHRSTSSGSVNSHASQNKNRKDSLQGNVPSDAHQLQQFLSMQQGNNTNTNQGGMNNNNALPGMVGGNVGGQNNMQMDLLQGLGGGMDSSMNSMSQSQNAGILKGDGGNYQDRIAAQKKKVIRQQQQRLLLLRHASKCKEGPNCKTKFCAQMMTLWKHMKKCRDKNCKTSHCLSSRCVLNHYRICKSQGRTSTCEVCGPVMEQIKRQDQGGSMDSSDPLAAKPDNDLPNQALPQQQQLSGFGQGSGNQNNVQAMQQQAMQQLYQQQQQAIQQNQEGQPQPNSMQGMGGSSVQNEGMPSGGNQQQDPQQMQNMQNAQQKLQQQQQVLRQLQKQQAQLLEQQKQLQEQQKQLQDPNTQQAQQLQQQHALLQQLQRRCQQQQALIQQELMLQMKALEQGGQDMQSIQQQMGNSSQGSQQMGNSSQNSQHSHHSQQTPNQNSSQNSNLLQGNSLQVNSLNQGQMQGMGGDNNNEPMSQIQTQLQMQNQMQNQMQGQPSSQEQQLLQMQQALNVQQQGGMQSQNQNQPAESDSENAQQDSQDQADATTSGNDPLANVPKPMSSQMSDGSEKSGNTKGRIPKARPKPTGRGKGARGRGGKGKRLRDIADDLGSAGAAISATDATSMLSKKRNAEDMGGDNKDEPANKSSKGDGPLPDSEKSEIDGDTKDGEQSSSLTSSMPKGDVEQHLLLLHKGLHLTSRTITHKCLPIVQQLIDDPFGWVFRDAVDPVVFGLPDYFEVVKNPMHLLLVKKKLENAVYTDMASFERDVKLVFENAILYNGEESEVGQLAQTMMGVFEREYKKVCEVTRNELAPIDAKSCKLCGLERRQFQPPVLYCVGMTCGMQKVKRNTTYYTKGSQQNTWCEKCYSKLKENESIMLDDGSETRKSKLHELRNNATPEETWVKCYDCKANVHQVCALTSDRIRKPDDKFFCPKCDLKNRRGMELRPTKCNQRACDLQKCAMSDFIEKGLKKSLQTAYELKAKEHDVAVEEIETADHISIRVLSHIEKTHTVRDEMYNLYSKAGCPSDFLAHTKCIGLFQRMDGVDILMFALYVYEYGHHCAAPNQRRVYISYLDSVQYFEPRMFRTVAYQSVIIEYLRFVKQRGFHTAHIWSCPPTPGDEYVFYCHPPAQKIPQEEKLRNWYIDLLSKAEQDGIVVETTNFYDEYFTNGGANAPSGSAASPMSLPYFEGDYIPGEIENILSHLTKEEKRQMPIGKQGARRTGSKLGTRSNPGSLLNKTQDKIMLRLGKAIFNMKENLMIVRLRSKLFIAAVERGDDVTGWPDDEENLPLIKGKNSSVLKVKREDDGDDDGDDDDDDDHEKDDDDEDSNALKQELAAAKAESEMEQVLSRHFHDATVVKVGTTVDNDPQFDTELFENRQLFLNYCQMNHCQFDDLRKAKHSTMLVLHQLHNPMTPKFLQACGACHRDIAYGNRFHCNICANFDLCDDCYKPVTSGVWSSRGEDRYCHDSSHTFSRISLQDSADAKRSQEERQKSLQAYLEVLKHAANCEGPPSCRLNNCEKMKKLFVHVQTCELTYLKGCKVCHRLVSLIIVHARSCSVRGSCSLPFCDKIRERNERSRRQQQLMDDRRRQAQNSYYGAGDS